MSMTYQWQTCDFDSLNTLELYAALRLRQQIFVLEQNCLYLDLDNLDQVAIHIMCWRDGQLLAYQRCLAPGTNFTESALGRIVVSARAPSLPGDPLVPIDPRLSFSFGATYAFDTQHEADAVAHADQDQVVEDKAESENAAAPAP